MITNNYIKACMVKTLGTGSTATIKDVTGTEHSLSFHYAINDYFGNYGKTLISSVDGTNARGVGFFYGGTEPTAEDYKSDGTLVTGLATTAVCENVTDDNGIAVSWNHTLTNNNDYDVTIDEACWFACVFYTASLAYRVLADRTKLEAPITIPAGGVGQVTYTIRMNYPAA